jgi:hypothetical protein
MDTIVGEFVADVALFSTRAKTPLFSVFFLSKLTGNC